MAPLLFVRHGQASFDGPDYDVLSPLGRRQARALGRWLAGRYPALDLFAGPRRRHVETAEEARAGAAELGVQYQTAVAAPLLDEIPIDDILRVYLPRVSPGLGLAAFALGGVVDGPGRQERISLIYRAVALWWRDPDKSSGDFESAAEFEARIARAAGELAGDSPCCAFTSAGPLVAALSVFAAPLLVQAVSPTDIANCAVVELTRHEAVFRSMAFPISEFLAAAEVTFI